MIVTYLYMYNVEIYRKHQFQIASTYLLTALFSISISRAFCTCVGDSLFLKWKFDSVVLLKSSVPNICENNGKQPLNVADRKKHNWSCETYAPVHLKMNYLLVWIYNHSFIYWSVFYLTLKNRIMHQHENDSSAVETLVINVVKDLHI